MPRERSPNRDKAYEIYKEHNGDIKNREISKILNISEKTISGWKSKDNWSYKMNGVLQKKIQSTLKKKANKKSDKKEPIAEEVKELIDNDELTDKQRLFCIYYIRCFNATKAYQKAYKCSHESAMSAGSRLLRKQNVQEEIKKLKQSKLNREMLKEEDIFQKYMDIAFADITDYVEFGRKDVPALDKEGKMSFIQVDYCNIKNSSEIDGTIVSGITQGKYGTEVRLEDRMKALKWLADHMDLATVEQRVNIEKIKADIELTKAKEKEVNSKSIL